MNKELEQQAREWLNSEGYMHLGLRLTKRGHNGDSDLPERVLAAFAAHLEAQSKPIQGEVDGWISVDDRLPEYGNPVLIVVLDITSMGYREKITGGGHMWFYIDGDPISYSEEPTHWQPLPPPPVRASPQ